VIVVVLHQQNVDLLARHGGADRLPAAIELGGRNRRLQPPAQAVASVASHRCLPDFA
jgi:hypothetical protein